MSEERVGGEDIVECRDGREGEGGEWLAYHRARSGRLQEAETYSAGEERVGFGIGWEGKRMATVGLAGRWCRGEVEHCRRVNHVRSEGACDL